jgi:hypothetical protein
MSKVFSLNRFKPSRQLNHAAIDSLNTIHLTEILDLASVYNTTPVGVVLYTSKNFLHSFE